MTYTYTWTSAEESSLRREDEAGNVAFVPVAEGNRDYAEFVASGAVAEPYVEPYSAGPSEDEVRRAYQEESDPLYFKWQAGEGTEQAWKDKRDEIHNRYATPKSHGRVPLNDIPN